MIVPFISKVIQSTKDTFFPTPKILVFEEIGWSIIIPSKFKLVSQKEIDQKIDNDSNCKTLFVARRGKKNMILCKLSKDSSNTIADIEEINIKEKNTLVNLLEKKYAQFLLTKVESHITNEKIDTLNFNKVEVIARTSTRIIYSYHIYHGLHNGRDVAVAIGYDSDEAGTEIINSFKNSKFR